MDTREILDFISNFKGAEDTFLHGCCYWFAFILKERFHDRGYLVDIFYEPVEGHFVSRFIVDSPDPSINNEVRFFDIRGDVSNFYHEENLENMWLMKMNHEKRWAKLICDCKDFILPKDYPAWLKEWFGLNE